jgi:hypothetical protein
LLATNEGKTIPALIAPASTLATADNRLPISITLPAPSMRQAYVDMTSIHAATLLPDETGAWEDTFNA